MRRYTQYVFGIIALLLSQTSFAAGTGLTYHGRIMKPDGSALESSSVQFTIQIRSPGSEACLLYQETQTIDMSGSGGAFSLEIGENPTNRAPSSIDGGLALNKIFANHGTITVPTCNFGTDYTPNIADGRLLYMSFNDGSGLQNLSAQKITYVPFAIEAMQLNGYTSTQFLRVDSGTAPALTTANLNTLNDLFNGNLALTTTANVTSSGAVSGSELRSSAVKIYNGANYVQLLAPTLTSNVLLTLPASVGTSGQVLQTDGTGTLSWVTPTTGGGGTLTAVNVTAPLTNSGTATVPTIGIPAAGSTQSGYLTSADWNIFNGKLDSSGVTSSLITTTLGYVPLNRAGDTMSGTLVASEVDALSALKSKQIWIQASTGTGATILSTAATNSNFTLNFPASSGTSGQYLQTDGSGNLSWASPLTIDKTTTGQSNKLVSTDASGTTGLYGLNILGSVAGSVSLLSSATTANYSLTLPASAPAANQILQSDASGALSWISSGSLTSNAFVKGGNSFGANAVIGLNDNYNLNFATNGTNRMMIKSNGNIGIGTTNPGATLHVLGAAAFENNSNDNSGANFSFWKNRAYTATQNLDELGYVSFYGHDGSTSKRAAFILAKGDGSPTTGSVPGSIGFYTTMAGSNDSTEKLHISANGNVGIGTATPAVQLDIAATGNTPGIYLDNYSSTSSTNPVLIGRSSRGTASSPSPALTNDKLLFLGGRGDDGAGISSSSSASMMFVAAEDWSATAHGTKMTFFTTQNGTTTAVERLRISDSGNVGIGTTSPSATLDVVGSSSGISGQTTISGPTVNVSSYGGTNGISLRYANGTSSSPSSVLSGNIIGQYNFGGYGATSFFSSTAAKVAAVATENWSDTTGAAALIFATRPSGTTSASVERMRVDPNGNVGIGTSSPTVSLDLSGRTDAIRLPAGTTAQQPASPTDGMLRFNTTNSNLEYSSGGTWTALGSGGSSSFSTITGPGAIGITAGGTNQNVTLTASGTGTVTSPSVMTLTSTQASTSATNGALVVSGGLGVGGAINTNSNITAAGTVNSAASNIYKADGDAVLSIESENTSTTAARNPRVDISNFMGSPSSGSGGNPGLNLINYRGTSDTSAAMKSGESLGSVIFGGSYNTGGGYYESAGIWAQTTENFSGSAGGTQMQFYVTPNGTKVAKPKMTLDQSGYIGINTITPTDPLHIVESDSSLGLRIENQSATASRTPGVTVKNYSGSYSGGPTLLFESARGSSSSATSIKSGDSLGQILFQGLKNGSNYVPGAQIFSQATEDWASGTAGTSLIFNTIASGATANAERMRIDGAGNIGIGSTAPKHTLQVGSLGGSTTKQGIFVDTYLSSGGAAQYNGNWTSSGYWGLGPATAASDSTIMLGNTNDPQGTWSGTQSINFVVGGKIGIGTTSPLASLDVRPGNSSNHVAIDADNVGGVGGPNTGSLISGYYGTARIGLIKFNATDPTSGDIIFNTVASGTMAQSMIIRTNGNVGVGVALPGYKLAVAGDVSITSGNALKFDATSVCTSVGCTSSSDERLKENIQPLQDSLVKIQKLQGVEYNYRDKAKFTDKHQIGVIAQEVEKVYPEVVITDKTTGLKSVAYDHLVAPLIEAFKNFYHQWSDDSRKLHAEISDLQKQNRELQEALCEMNPKSKICQKK